MGKNSRKSRDVSSHGYQNAWLSELQVRANVGLLAQAKWRDIDVLSECFFWFENLSIPNVTLFLEMR